ncbi:MAG: cupin domain-containing protein [Calditrichaeota bacterium]|nr:cupin domain-containing protein [Calditrichota bacterium]
MAIENANLINSQTAKTQRRNILEKNESIGEVPPHAHGAQWGVVIDGEMELTIGGETKIYRKGDHYFIPAGVMHSARFNSKVFILDYFEDKNRYNSK